MKTKISIILPCHNEEKNIPLLIPEIIKMIPKKYSFEIILVNDGSSDNTYLEIIKLCKKNKNIKGISFDRNFGHQEALREGILKSAGNAVITMDSDFQHPPSLIPKLIKYWEKGYDLVQARKIDDKSSTFSMKIQRKIGYFVWNKISDGIIVPGISDFRLIDKHIARYINLSKENMIFLRGLVMLASKNPIIIPYKVGIRKFGKSSYSTKIFINMFINGFISFSTKPMRLTSLLGLLIFIFAAIFLFADIIRALVTGSYIVQGWTTVIILLLILNGFIIFYLGILGEYIGVIFKETKKRPSRLISSTSNFK